MVTLTRKLLKLAPIDPTAMPWQDARHAYVRHRVRQGWERSDRARLLTWPDENVKFGKTKRKVVGLALAPARESGHNVCPHSTPQCRKACVSFAGNGEFPAVQRARITKTLFLHDQPQAFVSLLHHELELAIRRYGVEDMVVRLNTFSDLPWETIGPALFDLPVQFYDYTKIADRLGVTPPNYHLTYSASERTTDEQIAGLVRQGHRVAVVFKGSVPPDWQGVPVICGDTHDDRTLDPAGVIVGLKTKGRMRKMNVTGKTYWRNG